MAGSPFFAAVQPEGATTMASKKVKLSAQSVGEGLLDGGDIEMSGMDGDDKGTQCGSGGGGSGVGGVGSSSSSGVPSGGGGGGIKDPRPSLESIRQQISEQFDIEILLKHREIRLIEQEVAKTQIAIEQLRRCALVPYAGTPEAQPGAPIPEFAPGPGVVDGPYTRHYRQWLLQHPNFDPTVEPFAPAAPPQMQQQQQQQMPMSPPLQMPQQLGATGRPQRQSAMKAQTKTGEQVCLFRKRDGVLVRLECTTCHRSNFSSAQGFINHCRIAHQQEYASHDAAAEDCGHPVDESEASLVLAPPRGAPDGPARHTRQTQPMTPMSAPTHHHAYQTHSRRNSTPVTATPSAYINPYVLNPGFAPTTSKYTSKPSGAAGSRKPPSGHARRHSAHMTTPKTPGTLDPSKNSPPTPPLDFSTPHLQGLLKRKRLAINLEDLVKETTGPRVDWEQMTLSEDAHTPYNTATYNPATSRPATPESADSYTRRDTTPSRRSLSSPVDIDMSDLLHISSDEEDEEEMTVKPASGLKTDDEDLYALPQDLLSSVSRAAAMVVTPGQEEVPKHVRFSVPGLVVKKEEGLMG